MNTKNTTLLSEFLALALLAGACTTHVAPYRPKRRMFAPEAYAAQAESRGSSLYVENGGIYADRRAADVGDVLVIRVDEADSATRTGSTELGRKAESSYGVPASLGLLPALAAAHPSIDPTKLFGVDSSSSFAGSGRVEKSGRVTATLPVRVRRVLPNGDLYIEGTKVVMVGHEEQHLYLSGIVRPEDVLADNSIPSSRIAEAEIEITGRGDVSDQQRQGWLSRLFGKAWPF
ncbi:MAG: flagellar basal body L-ring protein FlgH [Myxococcales bacterium]|nr:flagellar basal body L-ring protein FlgH [Myxococcales bacterium]